MEAKVFEAVIANESLFDRLEFNKNVDRFVEDQAELVTDLESKQRELVSSSITTTIFQIIISLTVGILITLLISRSISKPLDILQRGIKIIGKGNLSHEVTLGSKDEFGNLAKSFNEMTADLRKTTTSVETLNKEIEEHRQSKELLIQAKEDAERATRIKSEFLANMSHELRTPLNHIIGFTELIVDENFGELNETQKEYLSDSLQSSQHLLSLINDVLDISKIEAGKFELEPIEVDLRSLMEDSLKLIKEKAMKQGIKLVLNIKQIPVTITADKRKLKQILYNLLSNAVKFTSAGGAISLGVQMGNGDTGREWLEISVKDTGIGLAAGNLEDIFEPFAQVESSASRCFQGTGLGLTLTKKFVNLHGGEIWVRSAGVNKGSTFVFTIPAITNS